MTGLTRTAIAAVRARFGDLADPIMALREAGRTVAPFVDRFRVDKDVVSATGILRLADELRARQAAKALRAKQKTTATLRRARVAGTTDRPDGPGSTLATNSNAAPDGCADVIDVPPGTTPQTEGVANASVTPALDAGELGAGTIHESCGDGESRPVVSPLTDRVKYTGGTVGSRLQPTARVAPRPQEPIPAATCRCSRPRGHGGRCWVMRGEAGPTLKRRQPRGRTCGCGGPLSYSARGELCRKCVLAKNRKTSGQPARIMALECEVDALKSMAERILKENSAIRAQLDMVGR